VGAINKDYKSVELIEWEGCNGLHLGTGYVAAPQVVVTAAHVVAGAGLVRVNDTNNSYVGTVILFDSKKDVAAIYVPGLKDPSLKINTSIQPAGTQTTHVGFEGGGPFLAHNGPISQYNSFSYLHVSVADDVKIGGSTKFYEVNTLSNKGDSGGPLILTDGSVIGHLSFDGSTDGYSDGNEDGNLSYFVSVNNYVSELHAIEKSHNRVSTQGCLS
jgi:S1-C subfamily serine protease